MDKIIATTKKWLVILYGFLKQFIRTLIGILKNWYIKENLNWWQNQQKITQQVLVNNANRTCSQIHTELFDVLKRSHCPFLTPVDTLMDIHNPDWNLINGNIIYSYDLYVTSMPSSSLLKQYECTLTNNIYLFQQLQPKSTPWEYQQSCLNYPCIMNGMYVMNIKPIGNMIRLEISTNWIP